MKPEKICIQCRKPEKIIRRYKLPCVGSGLERPWKRHKFYTGTYEVGEHSKKAVLDDEMKHKALMMQRSAFRSGQQDILKKVRSIWEAGRYDPSSAMREIIQYCADYEFDVDMDKQMTDDMINQKKLT